MSLYLIIMGVQGAGKGVQARFIEKKYDIPQVSTGDLFRAMKTRDDELARRVQEIMQSGQLVPDDVTNEILQERLEQPDAANGAIFDGYPRNREQAQFLADYLASKNTGVSAVLLLKLDLYVAFKRAFGRVTNLEGKSYNIYSDDDGIEWQFVDHPEKTFPPRLEAIEIETGAALNRRPDDANAGAIIKRIDVYLQTTQPLIDYYRQAGLLIDIDAERSIKDVSSAIKEAIDRVRD